MREKPVRRALEKPGSGPEPPALRLLRDGSGSVTREEMIAAVDEELARLREILALLRGSPTQLAGTPGKDVGKRPKRRIGPGRMHLSQARKHHRERQGAGSLPLDGQG